MSGNDINARITEYLEKHPDATTDEIADGIDEDTWKVQLAVCHLDIDDRLERSCFRQTDRGRRPGYRVKNNGI